MTELLPATVHQGRLSHLGDDELRAIAERANTPVDSTSVALQASQEDVKALLAEREVLRLEARTLSPAHVRYLTRIHRVLRKHGHDTPAAYFRDYICRFDRRRVLAELATTQ